MSNQCGGQAERPPSQEEDYADVEKPKPKNAITAMGFFTRVKKETFKRNHHNEKLNHPEFTKQCTAEWKTLSEEERAPYVAMACEDYDRYEAEMIEYDPNFTTNVNKRKRSLKDKDPNLPKRPISAFFIFSAAKRQELKDANPDWKYSTVAQELGRIWNNLSEDEKKPYQDQGKAAKEEYNAKMAEYNQRKSLEMEQVDLNLAPTA